MPMPHVCLLLERLLLKRKISASGQRVLGNRHGSSQTFWIYRRYRSCDRETCQKNGFSVVRDLCGHGVGVEFHEEPDVEHFGKKGTGMLLVPGMVFTIEPMINAGTWEVFIDEEDGWTVVTEDELPSAQWEHTFLMTENGLEILTH